MKKLFVSTMLLIILLTPNTNGQTVQKAATYYDLLKKHPKEVYFINPKTGQYNGKYTAYFRDGTINRECSYVNGELNGKDVLFYNYGNVRGLASVANYKMGLKDGQQEDYNDGNSYVPYPRTIQFYKAGNKQWEKVYFKDGNKVYLNSEEYYDHDGNVTIKKGYLANGKQVWQQTRDGLNFSRGEDQPYEYETKRGLKNGYFKGWWQNGVLGRLCYYKNGLLDGPYKEWNDQNQLTKEVYYSAGIVSEPVDSTSIPTDSTGGFKMQYKSGRTFAEGNMVNGALNGRYREYYYNFQLAKDYHYINGKLSDTCKEWYTNGKLKSEYIFVGGLKNGVGRELTETGIEETQFFFEDGKEIKRRNIDHANGGTGQWYDASQYR